MRTALKTISIIAVVIGALAIIGAATQDTVEQSFYSLIGGGFFATQGILSLVYISKHK